MDKPILKTIEQRADEVVSLFMQGIECWQRAGELVVDLIDEDRSAIDLIKTKSDGMINGHLIAIFERIGRKQLLPRLANMTGPGPERLKKMPYSIQEKYISEPIEVLVLKDGEEGVDRLQVAVTNLTTFQASQVFDRDTVRSLPAQRAWLESERMRLAALKAPEPAKLMPYRIVGRKVTFIENCTLTSKELARILSEIE